MIDEATRSDTYNLGSGIGLSVNEVINLISNLSRKQIDVDYRKSRRSDVRSVVLDVSKLKQDLGFSPSIDIKDGIQELLDFSSHTKYLAA